MGPITFDLWTDGFSTEDKARYAQFLEEEIDEISSFEIIAEGDSESRSLLVGRDPQMGFRLVFNQINQEFELVGAMEPTGNHVSDVMSGYQSTIDSSAYVTKEVALAVIEYFVGHLAMHPKYFWLE